MPCENVSLMLMYVGAYDKKTNSNITTWYIKMFHSDGFPQIIPMYAFISLVKIWVLFFVGCFVKKKQKKTSTIFRRENKQYCDCELYNRFFIVYML